MKIKENKVYSVTVPESIRSHKVNEINKFCFTKKHFFRWESKLEVVPGRKKKQHKYYATYVFYSKRTALRFWAMFNL
jgi:hypothetical protein